MASSRNRAPKCGHCRRTGHNKRTCPNREKVLKQQKEEKRKVIEPVTIEKDVVEKPKERANEKLPAQKKSLKQVFVRAHTPSEPSSHVVNLSQTKSQNTEIPIYTEEKATPKQPKETLDFAALIEQANKQAPQAPPIPVGNTFQVPFTKKKTKEKVAPVLQQTVQPSPEKSFTLQKIKRRQKKSLKKSVAAFISKFSLKPLVETYASWRRSFEWQLVAIRVVAVCLVIALPFPAVGYYKKVQNTGSEVVDASTFAFNSLQSSTLAAFQANLGQAESGLSDALEAFSRANELLDTHHTGLQAFIRSLPFIGTQLEGRQALVQAGHHFALGNTYLIKGVKEAQVAADLSPTTRLETLKQHLTSARPQYEEALGQIASIDPSIVPEEHRATFEEARVLFAAFVDDMEDMTELIDALVMLLGNDDFKRYIVVFQNNWEIRPTGGFWGSFAVCDIQKGNFLGCDVPGGGTYDLQGQYSKHYVPPIPLQFVNERFECHDQNWWPHFPVSANKLMECYEDARGASVDGVIALNSSVLEKVLEVVGPVNAEEYDLLLDTDSALQTLQSHVESDAQRETGAPKQIIGDLLDQFLTLVTDMDTMDMMQLLTIMHDSAHEKDLQVYVQDKETQKLLRSYGWTGEIETVDDETDYLMVVNTNIAGEKSDARVEQHINHQAEIQEDGSIVVTTHLMRTHTGDETYEKYNAPNVNYVRFYVPEGSVLLDARGFEYPPEESFKVPEVWYETDPDIKRYETDEVIDRRTGTTIARSFGKTMFGNWIMTRPGEESNAYVVYKLPFTIEDLQTQQKKNDSWYTTFIDKQMKQATSYTLVAQPQSGVESTFHSQVLYPEGWSPVWRSHDAMSLAENGGSLETELTSDLVMGVVMEKNN